MNREYQLGKSLLFFLLGAVILLSGSCSVQQKERRTNVLIFLVDALRADHLGCYGYSKPTSPFIDEFAEEAILFEHATSQSSWTYPSVASIFTGFYPSVHGVHQAGEVDGEFFIDRLSDKYDTLAEVMSENGWDTAAFVANPWFTQASGFQRGFSKMDTSIMGHVDTGDKLTALTLDWLREYREGEKKETQGLFLYLHYMETHAPFILPPDAPRPFQAPAQQKLIPLDLWQDIYSKGYYNLGDRRDIGFYEATYDNCIRFADSQFRQIIKNLEAHPEDGDWIVIFTADHGESLFDDVDGRAYNHGWDLYLRELWVPLIIKIPAESFAAQKCTFRAQLLDIPSTLCDLLGLQWPQPAQGTSLLPAMTGQQPADEPEIAEWSKRTKDTSIIIDNWHFMDEPLLGWQRLYNLKDDKNEFHDLSEQYPEMMQTAQELLKSHKAKCAEIKKKGNFKKAGAYNPKKPETDKMMGGGYLHK